MATNTQKCANCEKTGLPILPVRYSVLPKNVKARLPDGISGTRVTDVALDSHHYGLRTLREGWVYLFYEVGPRGNRYWEAYKVTSDGRLWKQTLPLPQVPITDPACAQRAIAVPMDLIAIERPEKCTGRVFIAFSEHAWHQEVFDRYALNETLRNARMQFIKPSEWIASGKDANGHAIVATEQAINDVIEYMPGFDPKLFSLPDEKDSFSDEKGNYKDDWLKREVTRYPMYIRQASPTSASQELLILMKQIGTKSQGADGSDHSHPPMILALWDGIGNVHELNGFRGDPASWLDVYVEKERTLQVGALQAIDSAHAIICSRADQDLTNQEIGMHEGTALGKPGSKSSREANRDRKLANATPAHAIQINTYYNDMNWMDDNRLDPLHQSMLLCFGESTSAGTKNSGVPYIGERRDQIMNSARAFLQVNSVTRKRRHTAVAESHWTKYENRLKRQDIESFRKQYNAIQAAVFNLQESRSSDVGKWLQARLFLDTLEDYDSTDLVDALSFEILVTDALAGIGSTPKGKTILEALVTQWAPLQSGSLIWRVFAMNQKEARQELGKLINMALEKKDIPLESGQDQAGAGHSSGVNAVILAAGMLNKLNSHYKNLAKLALEKDPKKISPLGALFKRLEVDRFGMTVGDAIFAKFRINQLGNFVGEKIVQTVLFQRAGVSYSDAIALVRQQAKLEKLSRQETIERLLKARSLLRTDAPANVPKATQALYDVWNAMESTDDGIKALRSSRIAVVAGLLEAVNFYKLVSAATDTDTRLKLMQSGASMLSSLITITMTPYYGALKNSIRSQSWKLVGSGLSSFGTFISAWMDGKKMRDAYKEQQFALSLIYLAKTTVGGAASVAILIDATSTAAPLLEKLAKRYGTKVVIGAIETVTARVVVIAAMRAVTMLVGWEATIALILLQLVADGLTPNELESWCVRCAFGTGLETKLPVAAYSVGRYMDPSQQEKDFINAMTKLS